MIDSMMWLVAIFSLTGTVLNTHRKRAGFLFWIGTNAAWVAYDIHKDAHAQATLMGLYLCLAIYGFSKWKSLAKIEGQKKETSNVEEER